MMPRRRARFNISAPVVFRWKDRGGSYERGDGVTRDIGIGGMFIVTRGPFPPENATIRCEASLPSLDPNRRTWRLRVSGRVQRASAHAGRSELGGFAVRTMSFLLSHEDARNVHIAVN
jgi:hypothetical protein